MLWDQSDLGKYCLQYRLQMREQMTKVMIGRKSVNDSPSSNGPQIYYHNGTAFVLMLNVPANNFPVMLGQFPVFLS